MRPTPAGLPYLPYDAATQAAAALVLTGSSLRTESFFIGFTSLPQDKSSPGAFLPIPAFAGCIEGNLRECIGASPRPLS